MKIYFYTLGCKVNQYESQAVGELLSGSGHQIVNQPDIADAVVVNSCTVTAESDRKTRQAVRRFKRENKMVILMGCMTSAIPSSAEQLPEADIVIGNADHTVLPDLIREFSEKKQRIVDIKPHKTDEEYFTPSITGFCERTRAFMKIEDGCDRYCTYCIIPFARGVVRSRGVEEIRCEAEALAKNGFCEIVLVGINLTSYGKGENFDIADAVNAAAEPKGIKRVRLGSIEPDHLTDSLLLRLKEQKKFCPQFHLALQSGSDLTLKRMNRHYDTAFFSDITDRIRKIFENPAITTDIMVGFAGESEEDFLQSLAFVKKIGFARSHVFAYSERSKTVAAGLPNQVDNKEKTRRAAVMAEAARDAEADFLKTQVGLFEEVLFETENEGYFEGYTKNYTRVRVKTRDDLSGKILKVKIVSAEQDYCVGEI